MTKLQRQNRSGNNAVSLPEKVLVIPGLLASYDSFSASENVDKKKMSCDEQNNSAPVFS